MTDAGFLIAVYFYIHKELKIKGITLISCGEVSDSAWKSVGKIERIYRV